jgi:DNA replication and repair protein RecF
MYLKKIQLIQFKNYEKGSVVFSDEINCFLGVNGSGKTNVLDAIHYLCLTKSGFNHLDSNSILHNHDFFTLIGDFQRDKQALEVRCIVEKGKKKQMMQNGKLIEKMSEHIGLLPIVLISPDDTNLIKEGSEERRKFFDNMLCQLDSDYLQQLIKYQHFLKQRNALLKNFAETGRWNKMLLEPYDIQVIGLSNEIAKRRKLFVEEYKPLLIDHYSKISENKEQIEIHYESPCLENDWESSYHLNLSKDVLLKRTGLGIHKDDFIFKIQGYPVKKFGSQGQQKSFVIALKLAQFQILHEHLSAKPLLLLDDIFDKLDDFRIHQLMKLIADRQFGQIFITDARPERSRQILGNLDAESKFFNVENGTFQLEDPNLS